MSQISRQTRLSGSPHGKTWNVSRVGREQHVRLLDPHEPFDRRAVEHDVAVERLLELRRRNLDVLVDAENVGELKSQEADVVLRGELENVLLACAGRVTNSRSLFGSHEKSRKTFGVGLAKPK